VESTLANNLFFCFFVEGVLFAPAAVFFEFDFAFNFSFIFSRPVIDPFAIGALHFN